MAKLQGDQLSLIAESEFEYRPIGDWDYDDIGVEQVLTRPILALHTNTLVSPSPTESPQQISERSEYIDRVDLEKLGSKKILDPNFSDSELGSKNFLDPKSLGAIAWEEKFDGRYIEDWKPKIGGLELKWVGKYQYWYWRYYDINGKKASIYLHKDYNKAVRKAMKIGVPTDAKLPKSAAIKADPQASPARAKNLSNIAQTAHGASRNPRAA